MITWIWTSRLSIKNFLTVVRQVAVAERGNIKVVLVAESNAGLLGRDCISIEDVPSTHFCTRRY